MHHAKTYKTFDHQHKPKTVMSLRRQHNSVEQMLVLLKRKWATKNPSFKPSKLRLETTYIMDTDAALERTACTRPCFA